MSINHYENFPVGSWALPRRLRPAVHAIYRFARTADDLADEGEGEATCTHTGARYVLSTQRVTKT